MPSDWWDPWLLTPRFGTLPPKSKKAEKIANLRFELENWDPAWLVDGMTRDELEWALFITGHPRWQDWKPRPGLRERFRDLKEKIERKYRKDVQPRIPPLRPAGPGRKHLRP